MSFSVAPANAQSSQLDLGDYEYEPGVSLREEEWYDPTDWFDDDTQREWEPDWNTDRRTRWYDHDHDGRNLFDDEYGYWDDNWDYGWHYNDITDDWDYGWHYDSDLIVVYPRPGAARARTGQAPPQRYTGEITSLFTRQEAGREFLFASMESDRGDTIRIKLGPKPKLHKLDLEEGDRITVHGRKRNLNGRTLLVASRVQSGDETAQLFPRNRSRSKPVYIDGTIENVYLRTVGNMRHIWTYIRGDDGQYLMADLGRLEKFDHPDFERGDEISVFGKKGRMHGRSVLVADWVDAENTGVVKVDRDRQTRERFLGDGVQLASDRHRNLRKITGTITNLTLHDHDDHQHFCAEIETEAGRTMKVDLGPQNEARSFDVEEGDEITAFGQFESKDGDRYLKAQSFKTGGTTYKIRTEDNEGGKRNDRRTDADDGT